MQTSLITKGNVRNQCLNCGKRYGGTLTLSERGTVGLCVEKGSSSLGRACPQPNPTKGSGGERRKLPSGVWGEHQPKLNLVYSSHKSGFW